MMKIYLLEHLPFIFFYFFNIFLLIIYRNIGGFETLENTYYFIFLIGFLLGVFLIYRYFSHKRLYDKLKKMPNRLEDSLSSAGTSPVAEGINRFLRVQYNLYQE